jgi:uncharacterized protein YfaS (alpha-2-macroglobulin family)
MGVDETETVLYDGAEKTKAGVIKGSFRLNDMVTPYKISANVFTVGGAIGYGASSFYTIPPVSVDFDLPKTMTVGDNINVVLTLKNSNPFAM